MTLLALQKITFAALLLTLVSCSNNNLVTKAKVANNDTAKIMRLLLDSAFYFSSSLHNPKMHLQISYFKPQNILINELISFGYFN